jgi:hypothetical protein
MQSAPLRTRVASANSLMSSRLRWRRNQRGGKRCGWTSGRRGSRRRPRALPGTIALWAWKCSPRCRPPRRPNGAKPQRHAAARHEPVHHSRDRGLAAGGAAGSARAVPACTLHPPACTSPARAVGMSSRAALCSATKAPVGSGATRTPLLARAGAPTVIRYRDRMHQSNLRSDTWNTRLRQCPLSGVGRPSLRITHRC